MLTAFAVRQDAIPTKKKRTGFQAVR